MTELPSTAALAFLGDAVHSLSVREMLVARGIPKAGDLNREALLYVTAGAQAAMATAILPLLTEEEGDVFRRARNSTHLKAPKHASGADYRAATGFEAVLGFLWHTGQKERVQELLVAAMDVTQYENNETLTAEEPNT